MTRFNSISEVSKWFFNDGLNIFNPLDSCAKIVFEKNYSRKYDELLKQGTLTEPEEDKPYDRMVEEFKNDAEKLINNEITEDEFLDLWKECRPSSLSQKYFHWLLTSQSADILSESKYDYVVLKDEDFRNMAMSLDDTQIYLLSASGELRNALKDFLTDYIVNQLNYVFDKERNLYLPPLKYLLTCSIEGACYGFGEKGRAIRGTMATAKSFGVYPTQPPFPVNVPAQPQQGFIGHQPMQPQQGFVGNQPTPSQPQMGYTPYIEHRLGIPNSLIIDAYTLYYSDSSNCIQAFINHVNGIKIDCQQKNIEFPRKAYKAILDELTGNAF